MSSDAISLWTETSSDPELIAGVRAGDTAAFGVLYERHVDAARKVAAMYTNTAADIDDVVSESFSRVLRALQRGDGPDLAFRAYLFTIVRRTGMDIINKGIRTKPRDDMGEYESNMGYGASSDEPAIEGFEHGMVADAFKSLPERWQAVLWYTEVEKKSPREIAPLLGLSANGVAALSYRAREALRQAYLQQHLNAADTVSCLEANAQLGAYVRGGLNKREQSQVGSHVETCERCAALVAELEDVNRGMRGIIAPLVLGVAGMAALEGGLPIGGAFGPGVAEGAGAAGSSTGAGAGTSVTTGASAGGSVAAGGIATGSAAAGGTTAGGATVAGASAAGGLGAGGLATGSGAAAGGFAAGGSVAGLVSGFAGIALPAVAVVAIVALAVNAAGALGLIGDSADAGQSDEVAAIEAKAFESGKKAEGPTNDPGAEPGPAPELPVLPGATPPPPPSPGDNSSTPATGAGGGSNTGAGSGTGTGGSTAPPGSTTPIPGPTTPPVDPTVPPTDPDDTPPPPPPTFALLSIGQAPLDYLEILRNSPVMSMTVTNKGDGVADDVTAAITVPQGLEFSAPSGGGAPFAVIQAARIGAYLQFATTGTFDAGGWTCELENEATVAVCSLPDLAAGATTTLSLGLDVTTQGALADDAVTHFSVTYGDITESYSVRTGLQDVQEELDLRYAASGQVAATQVGAPLMSCDLALGDCRNVMAFAGSATQNLYNNNYWSMIPLNEAGGEANSATTNLTLPAGAQVLYASLEWSANAGATDVFDGPLTTARIKAPGQSSYIDIAADGPAALSTDGGGSRQYYQSQVDITDLVQQFGAGQWSVADIALSATRQDPDPSYYGGFAITVIYSHASLPDSRVALFDGTDWVKTGDSTSFTFVTDAAADVTVGWVAWEGDRGLAGDRVDINGDNVVPLRWNPGGNWPQASTPTGDSGNAADSTAFGSKYANSLGVDAKPFRTVTLAAGTHVLTAGTSTDQYLIGALTVTIAYND